jgi:ribosomal protein S7
VRRAARPAHADHTLKALADAIRNVTAQTDARTLTYADTSVEAPLLRADPRRRTYLAQAASHLATPLRTASSRS